MNHLVFAILIFWFVFFPLFAMALCLAAKRFPGDGVNKWRDDFDSDAIRSSHPTNGPETGVAGSQYAVKLVSRVPVHGSVSVAIPHCQSQSNKVETRTAVTPAIGSLFPKTAPNGLAVPGCSESQTAPKGLGWPRNNATDVKRERPLFEVQPDRDTAGNTFAAIRRSILRKILAGGTAVENGKPGQDRCGRIGSVEPFGEIQNAQSRQSSCTAASHSFASPLLPTRITQKPVGPRLTGLLFCSGVLRRMG